MTVPLCFHKSIINRLNAEIPIWAFDSLPCPFSGKYSSKNQLAIREKKLSITEISVIFILKKRKFLIRIFLTKNRVVRKALKKQKLCRLQNSGRFDVDSLQHHLQFFDVRTDFKCLSTADKFLCHKMIKTVVELLHSLRFPDANRCG